jgi:hypothetical protein
MQKECIWSSSPLDPQTAAIFDNDERSSRHGGIVTSTMQSQIPETCCTSSEQIESDHLLIPQSTPQWGRQTTMASFPRTFGSLDF